MARTTIDTLSSLTQDWGGKGVEGIYTATTDELPFSGLQIQQFIKNKISSLEGKAGYWCISTTVDTNSYYHLWGYVSQAAYEADATANRLYDIVIPISTVQGDSYASYIYTSLSTSANIVVTGSSLVVPVKFCAVQISSGERINYGAKGTVQIERSTNNGQLWTRIATLSNELNSSDYSATGYPSSIDIGSYLTNGTQEIRIRATFQYEDTDGSIKTATSAYITIGATVTKTSLEVVNMQNYQTPILQSSYGTQFPLSYQIKGSVAKALHIKIQGSTLEFNGTYELASSVDNTVQNYRISDAQSTYGLLTHGPRKVQAWLTCNDGLGNTLTSPVITNTFMVVNTNASEENQLKPYILLQNTISSAVNFVQTKLCDYAVYNPIKNENNVIVNEGGPLSLIFYLTSYQYSFPQGDYTEYFRMEENCSPNTTNSLSTTVEVESDDATFNAYFRIWAMGSNGTMYNIMYNSTGLADMTIAIDNADSFAPTSGATFLLNPKVRNNSESQPERILNAKNNNAVVPSVWTGFDHINDGWITSEIDGIKVLRIPAGASLTISYNPFAQFCQTPNSSMTIEFDFAARNVTNEDDPIIAICEQIVNNAFLGIRMLPIKGNVFSASNNIDFETDFQWEEDKRTHIAININNAIMPNKQDALIPTNDTGLTPNVTSIALVRVFVNGNIYREVKFNTANTSEFCTGAMSNGGIKLGQNGADLDIYSIRCFENRALDVQDVMKDYISTLPTSAEKLQMRSDNDLLTSGVISLAKCKAKGLRCLIWHGSEPYKYASDGQSGYWEIAQYDNAGNYLAEYSGTICAETKSLVATRQGSTANTYYYSNLQTKLADVEETITVAISNFHSSITVSAKRAKLDSNNTPMLDDNNNPLYVCDVTGGNLGKNFPLENLTEEYDYVEVNGVPSLVVPDGWVDGNGKYRGVGYMVAAGTPLAQKLVNKINYASSMQSHLCGVTRLFNDLHTAVVGKNSIQNINPTCRVAKYTEPFLFFTQAEDSNTAVFRGNCTFGGGKMDKPSWGYVKNLQPMYMMIEGADNNFELTDFRVPFDEDSEDPVSYDPDEEGWLYNGLQCFDFDAGDTSKINNKKYPKANIVAQMKRMVNFVYLHSPMIKYYVGTYDEFLLSDNAEDNTSKYWCTAGAEAYKLKRYDFTNSRWIDAGLWNTTNSSYDAIDMRTDPMTSAVYDASTNKANFHELNQELIGGIVADFKKYAPLYFNVLSIQFHYCFINHFIAGTDNCSKNTYYVLDPAQKSVTIDGVTSQVYLWEMHQDDVDTVLSTDNNGRDTKPYYIDRMHPFADNDTNHTNCLYEGMNNALFNLIELAYEGTKELQGVMKSIFTSMCSLVSEQDVIPKYTENSKVSVWGCLSKYLFSVQNYFPDICFNEQARIRYETPEMWNYTSRGSGARGIHPITQSIGSMIRAEAQYIKRRLVYMASYAAWGDFSSAKDNSIGISDAVDSFSLQVYHLPNSNTTSSEYKFNVKPHQYIYPTGMLGQTSIDPHVRVAPGQSFLLNLGTTTSNDTGMSIIGANYYRSYGNVGDISCKPELTMTVNGKRLTEFIAEPTQLYPEIGTGNMVPAFRPNQMTISALRISKLSLKGCLQIGNTLNLTNCIRLNEIDIRDTAISGIQFPSTMALETVKLPTMITNVTLRNQKNLDTFSMQGYASLTTINIDCSKVDFDVLSLMQSIYAANPTNLANITLLNIDWDGTGNVCQPAMVAWMCSKGATLTGSINSSTATGTYTFAQKMQLASVYGDIDSSTNSLYLQYRTINIQSISIQGSKYIHQGICTAKGDGTYKYDGFSVVTFPSNGNNFAISNGEVDVTWSLPSNSYATVANSKTGELTISQFSPQDTTYTLTVTVNLIGGTSKTATATVGFYKRTPKLGDFAYLDGSFDDVFDTSKDLAGIVFARLWYQYNPDEPLPSGVTSNPILGYESQGGAYVIDSDAHFIKLIIVSKEYMVKKATNSNTTPINTSIAWGLYNEQASGNNGFSTAEMASIISAINTATGKNITSLFDLADLTNYTSAGCYNASGTAVSYAYADNIQASMTEEADYLNGGFRARNLPQNTNGAMSDWDGKGNTEKIVNIAKDIINYWISSDTVVNPPTTLQELADFMVNVLLPLDATGNNRVKFYQFAFPAAYACKVYEPAASHGTIANEYKAGNWYLPSLGELARLYHHFNISRNNPMTTTNTATNNNVPNKDYYNYDVNQNRTGIDAWNPIFAKAFKRINDAGADLSTFQNLTASVHWSSSECNATNAWYVLFNISFLNYTYKTYQYSVRPVVAYTFEI